MALAVPLPRHSPHFCERARDVPTIEGRITRPVVTFFRMFAGLLVVCSSWAIRVKDERRCQWCRARMWSSICRPRARARAECWKRPLSRTCVTASINTATLSSIVVEYDPRRGRWWTVLSSARPSVRSGGSRLHARDHHLTLIDHRRQFRHRRRHYCVFFSEATSGIVVRHDSSIMTN
jgi:hypothetical protein